MKRLASFVESSVCFWGSELRVSHHEISLNDLYLVVETSLCRVSPGSFDLVFVQGHSSDVCSGELGNLSCRAADTAAHVENLHSLLDIDHMSEVVFVSGDALFKSLPDGSPAEVKALSETVLVEISC